MTVKNIKTEIEAITFSIAASIFRNKTLSYEQSFKTIALSMVLRSNLCNVREMTQVKFSKYPAI